jgi:periodic tryptophan protein 1
MAKKAGESAIITSLVWVSRGYSKQLINEGEEPNPEDIRIYQELTKKVGKRGGGDIKELATEIEKELAKLDLEKYDEEEGALVFTSELDQLKRKEADQAMADDIEEGSSESVSSFEDETMWDGTNKKKSGRDDYPEELEDSEEEKEDYTIRKTDALIVAATAEDEHSNLEVYIYDHKTSDLYVHHEIILSSYPLCMEWLNSYGGQRTNLVIVGTFLPQIEIWNLDSEDCEPIYTLGGIFVEEKGAKKKKKTLQALPKKPAADSDQTHTDAVMCLSLNPFQSEYLASGSADTTVKIWDLEELTCKANITNLHKNKV